MLRVAFRVALCLKKPVFDMAITENIRRCLYRKASHLRTNDANAMLYHVSRRGESNPKKRHADSCISM